MPKGLSHGLSGGKCLLCFPFTAMETVLFTGTSSANGMNTSEILGKAGSYNEKLDLHPALGIAKEKRNSPNSP